MRDGKKIHGFLRVLRSISMLMCKLWVVLLYFALINVWHAYIQYVLFWSLMKWIFLVCLSVILNIFLFAMFIPLIHQR